MHFHDRGQDDPAVWKTPVIAAVAEIEEEAPMWEVEY